MPGRQVDNETDSYPAKLAKLIPAEVSAAYLAINSLVPAGEGFSPPIWASLVVLTVFCALYLWKIQNVTNVLQIAFTTASFPIWALNISSTRSEMINPVVLGVVLILVTVAIPLVPTSRQD
ncbi:MULTISPECIES: hypothetical protein [unclassified Bradyrhizobium]|uniref:hypothetical protein n=1 Tax=unclassified Bradyrhizobium TaxID=2631580 RepID=UPI00024D2B6B|nr:MULTISPECIES: hypothetical protein [Bradyrhizobium]EHR04244.1 hypothetical protein Bra471DRAFT_05045 [Bradyrhizobium sp. WSM471]UFW39408.1 hypothetical protein BcanWSM471_24730 [Bradyrhizobium canariense]